MPSANLQNHLLEFKERGFTVFPSLHGCDFFSDWHQLAEMSVRREPEKRVFGDLIEVAPELAIRAVANPTLLDFAELVMGPFVQLDGLTLVVWPPFQAHNPDQMDIHWHRDPWSQVPRSTSYDRPLAINALTYLQDLDDRMGPLRVIPRSHRKPLTIPTHLRAQPHPEEQLIYLRRGDVIVMHNYLVHSRTPNHSNSTRSYLSVYYNLTWLRTSTRFDGASSRSIIQLAEDNNDRRMLRLFGVDSQLEARTNSGFLTENEHCWEDWIREDRNVLQLK